MVESKLRIVVDAVLGILCAFMLVTYVLIGEVSLVNMAYCGFLVLVGAIWGVVRMKKNNTYKKDDNFNTQVVLAQDRQVDYIIGIILAILLVLLPITPKMPLVVALVGSYELTQVVGTIRLNCILANHDKYKL